MSRAGIAAAAALALAAGCAAGGKLRRTAEVVKVDVEKARKSGALKCAPKELALAETNPVSYTHLTLPTKRIV